MSSESQSPTASLDETWTDLQSSFGFLGGCLGQALLYVGGAVAIFFVTRDSLAAISTYLKSNEMVRLPMTGTDRLSYEFLVIVGLILFLAVVLSLFPLFLQRSFEVTKKARIQGDVWIDLLSLGYWTKLRLSAQANDRIAAGRPGSQDFISKTLAAKLQGGARLATPIDAEELPLREFTKRFEESYGRSAFSGPLRMVTVIYLIGWLSVLLPNGLSGGQTAYGIASVTALISKGVGGYVAALIANLNPVSAAFVGAYLFSVQSLSRRYLRSDFKPTAVTQASLRVVTAWIVALLLVALPAKEIYKDLSDDWLKVLGFFAGVFSLQVLGWIWDLTLRTIPGIRASFSGVANAELSDLDGLDSWHQDRLDEAGINYVRGLATADFLDLLISVRLPCETLVDWVDQAILRMHLNQETWKRLHQQTPIRTATDLLDATRGPNDHRTVLIKVMDKQAGAGSADAAAFADTLDPLLGALERDPNIAQIRVFREQMQRVVEQPSAFPPEWPIARADRFPEPPAEPTVEPTLPPIPVPPLQPGSPAEGVL